jgi:hypothetical protein
MIPCSIGPWRSPSRRISSTVTVSALLFVTVAAPCQKKGQAPPPTTTTTNNGNIRQLPPATAQQQPTSSGHAADTRTGQPVSSGGSNAKTIGIIAGILGAAIATGIAVDHEKHKQPNADDLLKKGPQLPKDVVMNHLIVDGLVGPGWPVGVDFQLSGPGNVLLDITTADKVHYQQVLTANRSGRGITISRPEFPDKLQAATFDVEAIAPQGGNGPPPDLRVYGMAAGPYAVGSIAIDQVTFGPSEVKMKQIAQYGFHSHSDFSNVCADFMFTGVKENHIVMKQDNETKLSPVTTDERAQGGFQGKGTEGQHLLQIRAWRGNSGDWVVAWSPDVVSLTK